MKKEGGMEKDKSLVPVANSPPQPCEYTPEAIGKMVVKESVCHPLTVFPTAAGIGLAAFAWLSGLEFAYLLSLVGLLGPTWFISQFFFRSEQLSRQYLKMLDDRQEAYAAWLKEQVKAGLQRRYCTKKSCAYANQGSQQFDRARMVREGIQELLAMKLNAHEFTFHRFLAAVEQTYFSILDNLNSAVAMLKSADSIDPDDLSGRIGRNGRRSELSAAEKEEKEALEERLGLWKEQMDKVAALLAKNEKAITAMESISARVADWQTEKQFAIGDIESAISELQELARFAKKINGNG